jgi:hypothetical protein
MKNYLNKMYVKYFYDIAQDFRQFLEYFKWKLNKNKNHTPHIVKQRHIKSIANKYDLKILVETGTYKGDMVKAQLNNFEKIYSIELGKLLWEKATFRFRKNNHIKILNGDSGSVLSDVVPMLEKKSLFWLDGHYSAGITAKGELNCPVYKELSNIFNSPLNHLIIIDDARLFVGKDDYPSIEELTKFVNNHKSNASITVIDDLIIINPSK